MSPPTGIPASGSPVPHARPRRLALLYPAGRRGKTDSDTARSLTFPGHPHAHMPRSRTPAGPHHQAVQWLGVAPVTTTTKAPTIKNISRLNSTAFELAVYASRPKVTPRACKTRFRLLARLYRVGLATHRIAAKGFCLFSSRPPSLGVYRDAMRFTFSHQGISLSLCA